MVPTSVESRLGRTARWVWPTVVAALTGALVAGVVEGASAPGFASIVVTAGFVAMLAFPVLALADALGRLAVTAWRPQQLVARLVDTTGAAPWLAGWIATLCVSAFALAWLTNRTTWWLASISAFRPRTVSVVLPAVAVAATLAVIACSRPLARVLTTLARRLDERWQRRGHRTLLTPRSIVWTGAVVTALAIYAIWQFDIRRRIGPLDLSPLHAPAAGILAILAVHLAWQPIRARVRWLGHVVVALGAAATTTALIAREVSPALTLEVWGDRPIAGVAIEQLYDLDAIRSVVALEQARPAARTGAPHPDILLITIDTMRADRLVPYGGTATMPTLDALAKRGAVFEWAYSPSNVTRRSIPSMVIGLAPTRIRGRVVNWAIRLDPRYVLLAERLQAGGYDTAGFMCCDKLWGREVRSGWERGLDHLSFEPSGHRLAKAASKWLATREGRPTRQPEKRPLFLWMHILEPHNWTLGIGQPIETEDEHRFYDASLSRCDPMLTEVLRTLASRPPTQAPIVIVTADHGESLGDHDHPYHGTDLYNSQLRVPLIIHGPGIQNLRIPETVSLTDLTPTIMELAGFEPPDGPAIDGVSFAGLATGTRTASSDAGTAFAAMIKDRSNPGGMMAVVRGGWKLIETGTALELYNVHQDPKELTNLVEQNPAKLRELKALLDYKRAQAKQSPFQ